MALDGPVEDVEEGVVDDADDGDARYGEAEGDAGVGEGVDEVCRAVDGVDYEGGCVGDFGSRLPGFFAHEGDGWVRFAEGRGDVIFDGFVGFGDDVDGCLRGDVVSR